MNILEEKFIVTILTNTTLCSVVAKAAYDATDNKNLFIQSLQNQLEEIDAEPLSGGRWPVNIPGVHPGEIKQLARETLQSMIHSLTNPD